MSTTGKAGEEPTEADDEDAGEQPAGGQRDFDDAPGRTPPLAAMTRLANVAWPLAGGLFVATYLSGVDSLGVVTRSLWGLGSLVLVHQAVYLLLYPDAAKWHEVLVPTFSQFTGLKRVEAFSDTLRGAVIDLLVGVPSLLVAAFA